MSLKDLWIRHLLSGQQSWTIVDGTEYFAGMNVFKANPPLLNSDPRGLTGQRESVHLSALLACHNPVIFRPPCNGLFPWIMRTCGNLHERDPQGSLIPEW
jgi:hypothetical protein